MYRTECFVPAECLGQEEASPVWTGNPASASEERSRTRAQSRWGKHPSRTDRVLRLNGDSYRRFRAASYRNSVTRTWKYLSFSSGSFNNSSTWSTKVDSGNSTSAKHGWSENTHRCCSRNRTEEDKLLEDMGLEGANLCCPGGDETPDPLQVHVDGLSVRYLLGPTQLQNHLQQHVARVQGQPNWLSCTWKCYLARFGTKTLYLI